MNAKMIVLITMSRRPRRRTAPTDRAGARFLHRPPSRPALAIAPLRLPDHAANSLLDPRCSATRMGLLRAEAVRTAKELGFAWVDDRIIMVDRTKGRDHDMHHFSHNMKVVTLRDL